MKRFIAVLLFLTLSSFGVYSIYGSAPQSEAQTAPVLSTTLTEKIQNIDVPYNVLFDAQMEHPGHAVVGASKARYDGKEAYRLRLQGSDQASRRSISLIYDMEWRLLGEEQFTEPEPVAPAEPAAVPVAQPADDSGRSDVSDEDEDDEREEDEENEDDDDNDEKPVDTRDQRRQKPHNRD